MRLSRKRRAETRREVLRAFGASCLRSSHALAGRAVAFAIVLAGLGGAVGVAQGSASIAPVTAAQAQKAPTSPRTSPRKKSGSAHATVAVAQPAPQPPVAPLPAVQPLPDWPANDQPSEATVTWDSHGLRVVAANSSLEQILKAVSTQTGATLEGFDRDQRVFGVYGPGPARDVIAELLDGSGYNVLMVGDVGQGTPRRIVLTAQSAGASQPGSAANVRRPADEEDSEPEQEAQQPEPPPQEPPQAQPPTQPGAVPVRTPQQMMQEMQQRQQQPPP